MSEDLSNPSKQKKTITKDSLTKLPSPEGNNLEIGIPEKYLNKNVQAMI